jgi:hypothetical protein
METYFGVRRLWNPGKDIDTAATLQAGCQVRLVGYCWHPAYLHDWRVYLLGTTNYRRHRRQDPPEANRE